MWRLIIENIASLQELETHWSFDDLIRANIVLNFRSQVLIKNLKVKK